MTTISDRILQVAIEQIRTAGDFYAQQRRKRYWARQLSPAMQKRLDRALAARARG